MPGDKHKFVCDNHEMFTGIEMKYPMSTTSFVPLEWAVRYCFVHTTIKNLKKCEKTTTNSKQWKKYIINKKHKNLMVLLAKMEILINNIQVQYTVNSSTINQSKYCIPNCTCLEISHFKHVFPSIMKQ